MKSLNPKKKIFVFLYLDIYPSDVSLCLNIPSVLGMWGKSYGQEVRCEKVESRNVTNQVFNDGFTYVSSRISVICASFTHKSFQIIRFILSKLELSHDFKNRCYLFCHLFLSFIYSYFYKNEILYSVKRMFENSSNKQNSKISKSAVSLLFQLMENIKVPRIYLEGTDSLKGCVSWSICSDEMSATNFDQSLVKRVSEKSFIQRDNTDLRRIMIFQTSSKKTLPSRETFRCLNPLHMSRNCYISKFYFLGLIKSLKRCVQHPDHNMLNCFWIFLKGMDTKYLKKFDSLSII
jgi:hypothetical protein